MDRASYVSSIENNYKKAKLNNVIQSLNDYICCSTPDETVQEYGLLDYNGPINIGQEIRGNKPSRKANTPVIVSNTFIGSIDANGILKVKNTQSNNASYSINSQYCGIQYSVCGSVSTSCTSAYWCDNCKWTICETCCACEDECGPYILKTSCCTFTACVHERCVFPNAYKSVSALDSGFLRNKYIRFDCACSFWPAASGGTAYALGTVPSRSLSYVNNRTTIGSYYASSVNFCYYFDNNKLCYCLCYPMNSQEQGWVFDWDSYHCYVDDSTSRSNVFQFTGRDGPFLCGFDADTGKMIWNKSPSNVSLSVSANGNGYYCSHLCQANAHRCCYFTCYNGPSSYTASTVRNTHLMVCANSTFCCTICVVSKLRGIENICIHERYL